MINLLPPKIKTEILEEKIKKLVIILGTLISISLLFLTLILFLINSQLLKRVDLQKQLIESGKSQFEVPEFKNLREKVILANKNLLKLDTFYQEKVSLLEIFEKISEILPEKIYLNNFSFQKEEPEISLSGFAPNRETFLEFKNNLERGFVGIDFPLQSLIEPTNFQIKFKVKK